MYNKKEIRKQFREGVHKRDKHRCRVCLSMGKLDAHHIQNRKLMPIGGYVLNNGISLCESCHIKAEAYFNEEGELVAGYSPHDLYERIGTSYEDAYMDSLKLLEKHVDDLVDKWHDNANNKLKLHEFLGISRKEYAYWVEVGFFAHIPRG